MLYEAQPKWSMVDGCVQVRSGQSIPLETSVHVLHKTGRIGMKQEKQEKQEKRSAAVEKIIIFVRGREETGTR